MKLVSWNIENALRQLEYLPKLVEAFGTDVLCLQELQIRQSDAAVIDALKNALPGYACHCSLPRDPYNARFRGGGMYGVATFVRGRWRAAVPAWDREGRVVVVRRRGLSIVNVYAVNGTSKPYYDENGRLDGDRNAFKRRFQDQVLDLGRELRREGGVIMAGDWNVSRTAADTHPRLRTEEPHALARASFNERIAAEGFVDVWRAHHPEARAYTWFNRRARSLDAARVDYVLVSEDLMDRIGSIEILARLPARDHAPVALDLVT